LVEPAEHGPKKVRMPTAAAGGGALIGSIEVGQQ
jgi:hypothetical protein